MESGYWKICVFTVVSHHKIWQALCLTCLTSFIQFPPVLTNSLSCYVYFADWTLFAGLVTYCAPIHSTLLHSSNLSLQLVWMLQSNKLVLIERERHEELNTGKGGAVYTGVAKSLWCGWGRGWSPPYPRPLYHSPLVESWKPQDCLALVGNGGSLYTFHKDC